MVHLKKEIIMSKKKAKQLFPGGPSPMPGPGPIQGKVAMMYRDCEPMKCAQCQGLLFAPAVRVGKQSSVHPNNPTGHDIFGEFPTAYCVECKLEKGQPAKIVS